MQMGHPILAFLAPSCPTHLTLLAALGAARVSRSADVAALDVALMLPLTLSTHTKQDPPPPEKEDATRTDQLMQN